ncbi:hypothetical protein [Endozoicomonas acroporae]|uniref:hypothetical protein n=1 Tax=Endozoicomonas acroporae TaxID=1701104 RepID=UPI003D79D0DD
MASIKVTRLDARDARTTLESAELRPHVLCQSSFDKLRMNGDRVQNVEIISGQLLKNQGEGGGHCVFDHHILPRLNSLRSEEYSASCVSDALLR